MNILNNELLQFDRNPITYLYEKKKRKKERTGQEILANLLEIRPRFDRTFSSFRKRLNVYFGNKALQFYLIRQIRLLKKSHYVARATQYSLRRMSANGNGLAGKLRLISAGRSNG